MSQHVLIVSPHFPPVNAPDMQRVRTSLPYFVAAGWNVTVLTVADPTPVAPFEPDLTTTIPAEVQVERVRCFSRHWTKFLGINNVALRSLPFLFLGGRRLLRGRRYDVVYFSTTMFNVLPLGRLWKMFAGVPYVVDLQDPWVTDFYDRPDSPPAPGGWKYRIAQRLARACEGWTMRGAAHLISVSAGYIDALRHRHAVLHSTPATVLPFGSADPDLQWVANRRRSRARMLPAGSLRLGFAGALGPGMLAAVELLFAAIAEVRRDGLLVSAFFFGTSYAPQGHGTRLTYTLAAKYGLESAVDEQPDRLPYFDALQVALEADANLLLGSTDLDFVPSKTHTVLAAGRPVLALAPTGSALVPRLAQLGHPCVSFPSGTPDAASVCAVAEWLRAIAGHRAPVASATALASFSARAVAEQQLAVFASVGRPT